MINTKITKIKDVSSTNYGNRQGHNISHIVIGMTNNSHSGFAYAKSYKNGLSPKISFNYIIDKLGNIYQTIDNEYAPYTINTATDSRQIENQECVSICFMPEWNGSSLVDEYDSGTKFPTDAEINQVFLLTKSIKYNGTTYQSGLYHYDGMEWVIDEAITSEDIKRPYESEDWSINEATEQALLALTKWLQVKLNINTANVLRVYDYFKTYNPAPYIENEGEQWNIFKETLNDVIFENFEIVPEKSSPISEETISENDAEEKINDLIEQYGPDAGKDIDNSFKATNSSITDVSILPGNKFQFRIGIHDTLTTTVATGTNEKGELVNKATTSGKLWDIGNVTKNVSWKTYLQNDCDEFNFEFANKDFKIDLKEGYNVGYWLNEIGGFNGNIFKLRQSGNNKELIEATCYGWLRYLKCDGWTSFENMTASQIFAKCCNIANIPNRIISNSSYVCKEATCYGKTLYEAIHQSIMETMVHEKKWYIIQPFFDKTGGGIEFRDILDPINIKKVKFSENSAIINWDFDSSIDESANIIVTYTEGEKDEKTGKTSATATGNAKDESTIKAWGRLSKVIQDQTSETGVLNVKAEDWLRFYNSPRRRIRLECLGIPGVIAGNIIYLEIYNVVSVGTIKGCLVVDDCTHKISGDKHTMELICEIVQDGTIQQIIYNATKLGGSEYG